MKDPISNFITKLKNANKAGLESVVFPYSTMVASIADILRKEGYVTEVAKKGKKVAKYVEVTLAYDDKASKIKGVKRISKLSKRLYVKSKELYPVRNGFGTLVISTPKGIVTGFEAKKANVGGEPLFEIW